MRDDEFVNPLAACSLRILLSLGSDADGKGLEIRTVEPPDTDSGEGPRKRVGGDKVTAELGVGGGGCDAGPCSSRTAEILGFRMLLLPSTSADMETGETDPVVVEVESCCCGFCSLLALLLPESEMWLAGEDGTMRTAVAPGRSECRLRRDSVLEDSPRARKASSSSSTFFFNESTSRCKPETRFSTISSNAELPFCRFVSSVLDF